MALKIIILGNSSSGKSSLALKLKQKFSLTHLDLDILAWEKQETPVRRSLSSSMEDINHFINLNKNWVIEGCYGDLIAEILSYGNFLIFLNPDLNTCLNNAKNRDWESHKYENLDDQNANLKMLETWIKDYFIRKDEFSFTNHQKLFRSFSGKKVEYNQNWNEDLIRFIGEFNQDD
ncbi:shikimate kinase [Geminocystis sp. NIES-3709]|uniref:shikimate kinase n=1 Tax=Geminocystis sp. NIES-3709 TaxID=1617448 RepID=UPI0005FC6E85|nr:shikimate kinase [Geminocystis sp. NIES-3709]BAQ63879.1 hypothetical protein GM3709_644 [Geminocystis sp. NIES-3709]